ncbi:hypothetical protein Ccr2_gp268 [Caulobacter phage Ccr2]|uniref:Uncharacterized protein n=4 Tax=Shapirovirus cbk TaxID=1204537 RepID=J3SMK3_9CAUD|nr:hypothetical protein D865_gp153 [Caulobacter phage phiCbK]ARB13799.1 hypothetical protein Ccr10_gp269 [Caulobacter phage Ccr10]ARB14144.1 hypothetical protein Ccr2_gp268 [Caulobacter phage Ccr2]ARB14838.1 hypothetical protein Ccr29_gp282 [Caulobacter phage Ccr29]ARB15178.1 hypothetical protein Ccr32_gp260 [Caulobacter phage Ccr32]ARB15512.1 hypothetical protein Ccr34_gp270 [Caulobacter phage Ccr34]
MIPDFVQKARKLLRLYGDKPKVKPADPAAPLGGSVSSPPLPAAPSLSSTHGFWGGPGGGSIHVGSGHATAMGSGGGGSTQILVYNGGTVGWATMPQAVVTDVKTVSKTRPGLTAGEDEVITTMVRYGDVELVLERDRRFAFVRFGLELAYPRVSGRMLKSLIKKGYLKAIEHDEMGGPQVVVVVAGKVAVC